MKRRITEEILLLNKKEKPMKKIISFRIQILIDVRQ